MNCKPYKCVRCNWVHSAIPLAAAQEQVQTVNAWHASKGADHLADGEHATAKFGVGEVLPVHVVGEEDLGFVWLRLATKGAPGAASALLLGAL